MKILVLCADYPDLNGGISLNYVHTRNVSYITKWKVDVTVLNFRTHKGYIKDGVKVISLKEYENLKDKKNDILICHAPNLRNHYLFLRKYGHIYSRIVFFFHGHEVMKITKDYPQEYFYKKRLFLRHLLFPLYDNTKFKVWKKYIQSHLDKLQLVFVSEWMYDIFLKNLCIDKQLLTHHVSIIYNSVSKKYETNRYDPTSPKEYDYITIRSYIDTSKYAIDIVNRFAKANPDKHFLVIGKGEFFHHFEKAENIEWKELYLNQDEIIDYLNKSKCALMPTRCDSQGVMACEMATFGIPLITSDIYVCRAVLYGFQNVSFISNDSDGRSLGKITQGLKPNTIRTNNRFFEDNTIGKEVELYRRVMTECNEKKGEN